MHLLAKKSSPFLSLQKLKLTKLSDFNLDSIDDTFVVTLSKNNKELSKFGDNIWDFYAYTPNHLISKINFTKYFNNNKNILEAKKLTYLIILFGTGRQSSNISISTLIHIYNSVIVPLIQFSNKLEYSVKYILENHILLRNFYSQNKHKKNINVLCSFLAILNKTNNKFTKINYKTDVFLINMINHNIQKIQKSYKQTKIIPSRILYNATKQRWIHIENVKNNIQNIEQFLKEYLQNNLFGTKDKDKIKIGIFWDQAVKKYNLEELFTLYEINTRQKFMKFISSFKTTCKHIILTYTGMRAGELYSLKQDCFRIENSVAILVGITTKLEITSREVKWITINEIKTIIDLLVQINNVTINHYKLETNSFSLFCSNILSKDIVKKVLQSGVCRTFCSAKELYIQEDCIKITKEDLNEIEHISFNQTPTNCHIGNSWHFSPHQYRRSLAIYAIQSGIVSLGALQIQLKHLFREMTLYYANGASYAKKLFNVPKNHIANDFNKLKPEIETLEYIKNVIFSDEKLFGTFGRYIENNIKHKNISKTNYILKNKEKTLQQFVNGQISYKETALGGCISTTACDYTLTRSLLACGNCQSSIIKQSKLNHIIKKQKEFIEFLDKDSIEYRTEVKDLEELENQKKLFLGSKE